MINDKSNPKIKIVPIKKDLKHKIILSEARTGMSVITSFEEIEKLSSVGRIIDRNGSGFKKERRVLKNYSAVPMLKNDVTD